MTEKPATSAAPVPSRPACLGQLGLFFSTSRRKVERAKAICRGCPIRPECLEGALIRNEQYGVWGGYDQKERRELRKKLGLARPRRARSGKVA